MILNSEVSGDIGIMVLPPGAGGEALPLDAVVLPLRGLSAVKGF